MRSPEQQYAFAKGLPIPELAKVLQGQSDVVDMWVAESILRQKMNAQKAQQGAQAQQEANQPKVVERDLQEAQQMMRPQQAMPQQMPPQMAPQQVPAPQMDQGVASLPGDVDVPAMAGGGIVAFEEGGPARSPVGRWWDELTTNIRSQLSTPTPQQEIYRLLEQNAIKPWEKVTDEEYKRRMSLQMQLQQKLQSTGQDSTKMPADVASGKFVDEALQKAGVQYAPTTSAPQALQQTAAAAAPAQGTAGIASLATPRIPSMPALTVEQSVQRAKEFDQAYGVDAGMFDRARKANEEDRLKDPEARREAGWMRVLEAGLNIMGGESPYGLTNIGKGAQSAAKGAMEDLKEFRKLEKERQRELYNIDVAENNFKQTGATRALGMMQHSQDKADQIAIKQAELNKDYYVANKTVEAHNLTRQDSREATLKATALKSAEAEMAKRLALNPQLAMDPTAYARELDNIYYDHLRRLMGEKAPTKPSSGNLQNINGKLQYVPK